MKAKITLKDLYRFPGFRPLSTLVKHPHDPKGYVLTLQRRQKKQYVHVAAKQFKDFAVCRIHQVRDLDTGDAHIYLDFQYRRVKCPHCNAVKQETLSWLASSKRFTQRFEIRIGRMCRQMPLSEVAKLNNLSWDQVWRMEMAYMKRLLGSAHPPAKHIRAIGVDEVSIKRRHTYQIVVADLDQQRPIWMGGDSRSETDMDRFFDELGEERSRSIRTCCHGYVETVQKIHHAQCTRCTHCI